VRLFIAIEPPDAWRDAARELRRALASRLPPDIAGTRLLRWVPTERLHLTLRYLGEVDTVSLEPLVAALAAHVPPLDLPLTLAAPGSFGAAAGAHTVWLGVDGGDALAALVARVDAALRAAALPFDGRAFRPHLTLARAAPAATRAQRRAIGAAVAALAPPPLHPVHVREVLLLRSHLGAQPRYERLARIG
jgi:2'-5' RNA ligase